MKESFLKIIKSWEFNAEDIAAKFVVGLLLLLIFYIFGRLFKSVFLKVNSKLLIKHPDILQVLSDVIFYVFLFLGYFIFLKVIGLEQYVTKILAGAGIVGIIAGFALKDIASNAFAGLLLFIKKPFSKGDWVQLDGHYGSVSLIGWLTTSLINKTGQEVFISNQLIYSSAFINYSKFKKRRICIKADVEDFNDLPQLKQLFSDGISKLENILPESKIDFYVTAITTTGNFSFELMYWITFDGGGHVFRDAVSKTILEIENIATTNKITIKNTTWISDEKDGSSSGTYGSGG